MANLVRTDEQLGAARNRCGSVLNYEHMNRRSVLGDLD